MHALSSQRLEVHIENPALLPDLKDSTGFRVTYSPTLRPHDLGSIVTGAFFTIPSQNATSDLVIPAGLEEYDYVNVCPSTCTSRLFPPSGVKVLNARLHMHMHGQGGSIEVSQGIMQPSCSHLRALAEATVFSPIRCAIASTLCCALTTEPQLCRISSNCLTAQPLQSAGGALQWHQGVADRVHPLRRQCTAQ
jgi:hypothetical protein